MSKKSVPIFFAFPDGVLQYVCAECTALCCRGQGFAGSLKREMGFLFETYPPLAGMVVERERNVVTCSTPSGKCFFLRQDGLCQIEVEHGRSRKPGVCLIFPFNDFYRIGTTVAVAPHFLCPLRLKLPSRPGEVEGTHARIEETIRDTDFLEPEYVRDYIGDANIPLGETPTKVIDREISFRDRCGAGLGSRRFEDLLKDTSAKPAKLASFQQRVIQLMRWAPLPSTANRDDTDDILLALASALRLELLDRSSEGILRFLSLTESFTRRAFSMGQTLPTLQGVHGIVEDMRPMLSLLAWGDEAPMLKKTHLKSPEFGDPNLVSAAQTFLNLMPTKGVLPALEKAGKRLDTAADRTALVQQ